MLFLDLGVDYVNVLFVMIHQTKHLHTLSCMSSSLGSHGLQPTRLLCPWDSPWQEYRNGLPCPPSGDLSNPGLWHCRWILYHLSHTREAQEYWSGHLIPSPGELPDPGIIPGERASLVTQLVKKLPATWDTPVQFLCWEDPLEKE